MKFQLFLTHTRYLSSGSVYTFLLIEILGCKQRNRVILPSFILTARNNVSFKWNSKK